MVKSGFQPTEILFSPLSACNRRCAHCHIRQHKKVLPLKPALFFLRRCAAAGIRRVSFTGGEPFLAPDFLCRISRAALRLDMLFGRITTNAAWFKNKNTLTGILKNIFAAGYDGDICVSVDAFHRQDLHRTAMFIRTVAQLWRRPEMVSIAAVKGARDHDTARRLRRLAKLLGADFYRIGGRQVIRNKDIFIPVTYIALSRAGNHTTTTPWSGKWFKDDLCRGPGNIFFVAPDKKVYPCCGYANEMPALNIGTIADTPARLIKNAAANRFVASIFSHGLHFIRKNLERNGVRFPGKTSDQCFFCAYLAAERESLRRNDAL